MARSHNPRRPLPSQRGPKRTGDIGTILPGDHVEVARDIQRIWARLQRPRPGRVPVYKNGAFVDSEVGLDFEDTATVTFQVTDDPSHSRTIIKANAAGGPSGVPGGAVQTITHVGSAASRIDSQPSGAALNVYANLPAGVAVGDLLVVLLNSYPTANPLADISLTSTPAGWGTIFNYWRSAQDDGGNAGHKSVRAAFWKIATAADVSPVGPWVLANASGGGVTGYTICQAFRSTASAGQVGGFFALQTALTGSSFSSSYPSVAPAPSGSLSLLALTCPAVPPGTTWTFPGGYDFSGQATIAGPSGSVGTALGWILNSSGGSQPEGASGFSLGAFHRFTEIAQILVFPGLA